MLELKIAARNKHIDLVVTDRDGRQIAVGAGRIAVGADGAQHHETDTGELIPEDLERQALDVVSGPRRTRCWRCWTSAARRG